MNDKYFILVCSEKIGISIVELPHVYFSPGINFGDIINGNFKNS